MACHQEIRNRIKKGRRGWVALCLSFGKGTRSISTFAEIQWRPTTCTFLPSDRYFSLSYWRKKSVTLTQLRVDVVVAIRRLGIKKYGSQPTTRMWDSRWTLVWREAGTLYHQSNIVNIVEKDCYRGYGVLVWDCVSSEERTEVYVIASETVTAQRYRDDILDVRLYAHERREGLILQEENTHHHRACSDARYLEKHHIR